MSVFVEAETETGHVDLGGGKARGSAGDFEEGLLVREAEVAEAEHAADEVEVMEFFEDGDDGEILGAADVDATNRFRRPRSEGRSEL